jgi:RNA polymerase sigma-70 factor (ECF subfamily)
MPLSLLRTQGRRPDTPLQKDRDLVCRILAGESAAENELMGLHLGKLLEIARVRAGKPDAEDLVQDTMAAALVEIRRGDWKGAGPIAAYLGVILRRTIGRTLSRLQARPEVGLDDLPAEGFDPEAMAGTMEARERLHAGLRRLSHRHRDVLLRHYFEGDSVGQISGHLGIPKGTVLSRLHHARRALCKAMHRKRLAV